MKKRVQLGVCVLMALFLISSVAALTTVKVNTYDNHLVSVEFADTTKYMNELEKDTGNSSSSGVFTADYDGDEEFYLKVFVSQDKKFVVPLTRLGPYEPDVYLELNAMAGEVVEKIAPEPEPEPEPCNESWTCGDWTDCENSTQTRVCTDANDCETTEDKPEASQECEESTNVFATGMIAIQDLKDNIAAVNWLYVLYVVLGIVVAGGIVFLITKIGHGGAGKVLVLHEKGKGEAPPIMTALDNRRLDAAEKKIEEAKTEIEEIKKKEKELTDAEKEYKEAREKLEKLKEKKHQD